MKLRDQLGRYLSPKETDVVADAGDFWGRVMASVETAQQRSAPQADPRLDDLRNLGYTEDGLAQILDYASARGIDDPLVAAQQYEAAYPPPAAVAKSSSRWEGLHTQPEPPPDIGRLLEGGGDERWLKKEISRALRQMRSQSGIEARFDTAYPGFEFETR